MVRWLVLALALAAVPVRATQVNWRCPLFATNVQSEGSALDESFVFFLGSFAPGFVPTPTNVGEWTAQWTTRDRTLYNPQTRSFASRADYTTDPPPFLATNQAFIWGCNGACANAEWILATHPMWRWPAGDDSPAAPVVTWTMADASIAVVGSLNASGFVIKTGLVPAAVPPSVPPEMWRALYFTAAELGNAAVSGWEADPDWDGADTLGEYAAGTHPRQSASRIWPQTLLDSAALGGPMLIWTLPRDCRSQAQWDLQESAGLDAWVPAAADILVSPATAAGFQARVPLGPELRRFVRLHLTLAP